MDIYVQIIKLCCSKKPTVIFTHLFVISHYILAYPQPPLDELDAKWDTLGVRHISIVQWPLFILHTWMRGNNLGVGGYSSLLAVLPS